MIRYRRNNQRENDNFHTLERSNQEGIGLVGYIPKPNGRLQVIQLIDISYGNPGNTATMV